MPLSRGRCSALFLLLTIGLLIGAVPAGAGSNRVAGSPNRGYTLQAVLGASGQKPDKPYEGAGASFGETVTLSANGETALVGAEDDDNGRGAAWVFVRSGAAWVLQARLAPRGVTVDDGNSGIQNGGSFGSSLALSADGNTAVVGGDRNDVFTGAVWTFKRTGSVWQQQGARLVPGNPVGFGTSVALSASGHTLVVGNDGGNDFNPQAWIFTWSGSRWRDAARIEKLGTDNGINDGTEVAVAGDGSDALISVPGDMNDNGEVFVYTNTGTGWARATTLGFREQQNSAYVDSVALSGDGKTALIGGANPNGVDVGYLIRRSGRTWRVGQTLYSKADTQGGDSGVALSTDGNTALISGTIGKRIGAVWTFHYRGGRWVQTPAGAIGLSAKTGGGLNVPFSVAMSGDGHTIFLGGLTSAAFGNILAILPKLAKLDFNSVGPKAGGHAWVYGN